MVGLAGGAQFDIAAADNVAEVDGARLIGAREAVGKAPSVGREGGVLHLGEGIGSNLLHPAAFRRDQPQALVRVGHRQICAVGRPARCIKHARREMGEDARAARPVEHEDGHLLFAAGIGDKGKPMPVGRYRRMILHAARSRGQIAPAPIGPKREEVASRGEKSGAIHAQRIIGRADDILVRDEARRRQRPQSLAGKLGQCYGEVRDPVRRRIEQIQPAALPERYAARSRRGKVDVIVGVPRHLPRCLSRNIHRPEIEPSLRAAIGEKEQTVADPHRRGVDPLPVRQSLSGAVRSIPQEQFAGLPATIALPSVAAEIAVAPVEGDARAVGRHAGESGMTEPQRRRKAAAYRDRIAVVATEG